MAAQKIKAVIKNMRLLRSIHFVLMVFFGAFFSYNLIPLNLILGMISMFFAWQFIIIINDIFDIEIDKISNVERPLTQENISKRTYIIIGMVFLAISLIISLFLGWLPLIFSSVFIIAGYFYSAPPTRFRNFFFATVFIGIWSLMSFYVGFFACTNIITYDQFILSMLIFLAFSIGTTVKDHKDYEGDKQSGVNTIFTKYGLEKGTKIVSVLLLITFIIPLFLVYHLIDFLIIIPLAIINVAIFNWKKNKKKVEATFLIYFIEIAYVFLRYISVITF